MDEATYQKVTRVGILVKMAKNMVVKVPPPTFRARSHGIPMIRETRKRFEKLSFPAESAGKGAFLIAGYYTRVIRDQLAIEGKGLRQ